MSFSLFIASAWATFQLFSWVSVHNPYIQATHSDLKHYQKPEMGSQALIKLLLFGICFWLSNSNSNSSFFILQAAAAAAGDEAFVEGNVFIDRKSVIGRIDDDFVCATLDWWPPEKCDYGTCSWGRASLLNLVYFYLFFCLLIIFLKSFLLWFSKN